MFDGSGTVMPFKEKAALNYAAGRLLAESPIRQLVNGRIVVMEFVELASNPSTLSLSVV